MCEALQPQLFDAETYLRELRAAGCFVKLTEGFISGYESLHVCNRNANSKLEIAIASKWARSKKADPFWKQEVIAVLKVERQRNLSIDTAFG
ncbi:hypothetical protein [uncultured Methylovirgula sp.]|uniref:hypothetical protein n=1 Tax=uncultured Methylovirgula sp. TaxID=1285960 RepID=UPI002637F65C|nr:hypothetical protein [uncultured Methylovirgula sp.]